MGVEMNRNDQGGFPMVEMERTKVVSNTEIGNDLDGFHFRQSERQWK